MPLKLKEPRPDRSPNWTVRGTYLGVYVERSTGFTEKSKANVVLRQIRQDIERDRLAEPGEPVFLDAIVRYLQAGGDNRFLGTVDEETGKWSGIAGELGGLPISAVDQAKIDETAVKLYPKATPGTRNRQVHTPISAVLKHVGVAALLKRPKGWRGKRRTNWMTTEQAFRVLAKAKPIDAEFAAFLTVLLYTGMRLSEAIGLTCDRVSLKEAYAFIPETKNGDPRAVYLPRAAVVALGNLPRGLDRGGAKVFRFTKCGRIYSLMKLVKTATGADVGFVSFHVFRHTWATWMRRYAGLDTAALVETKAWRDRASVARYEHLDVSEESRKAELLPVAANGA